jgi:MFS family permease
MRGGVKCDDFRVALDTPGSVTRLRGFRLYWAARATSQFGDEVSFLALPWLVAEDTASPLAVALIEVVAFTPALVFGLPLGAVADRRSRKRSMVEADTVRFVFLMSIPLVAFIGAGSNLVHVLAVAAVAGTMQIFFESASQAALPDLVPADAIVPANARLAFTEGLAAVSGPALAGILIATIDTQGALVVDAATFAVSAGLIACIAIPKERYRRVIEPMRRSVRAGLSHVRRGRHIRALTLTSGVANVAAGMAIGMNIILFQRTLDLEGWQAGVIYGMNGIGGVSGSIVSGRLVGRIGMGRGLLVGLAAAGLGVLLTGLATRGTWQLLATGGSVVVGFGIAIAAVSSVSLRQHIVPSALLGRVTATYRLVVDGAIAVGALAGGVIGEYIGVREAILTAAGLMICVLVFATGSCLNGADPPGADTDEPGDGGEGRPEEGMITP